MKYLKLLSAILAMLSAAFLAPSANASGDESVQTANGVSYVSGGVGTASIDRLSAMARDFNIKLVFALTSGAYLSSVKVTIADASGKVLVDATSTGPLLLAKLPAGSYKIAANFNGKIEMRSVVVGAEKLKTIDFRWTAE